MVQIRCYLPTVLAVWSNFVATCPCKNKPQSGRWNGWKLRNGRRAGSKTKSGWLTRHCRDIPDNSDT